LRFSSFSQVKDLGWVTFGEWRAVELHLPR
jgi:hypothetical protein